MVRHCARGLSFLAAVVLTWPASSEAACCYFTAKDQDILQPSQKVFITWDPTKKLMSFTVQPKFEGNALDFGMVIPTPSQPKLHEMPRDFFKELAIFSILKQREFPQSKLLWQGIGGGIGGMQGGFGGGFPGGGYGQVGNPPAPPKPKVEVLETGLVGSLDYKIIKADRADDLFQWLKAHKYQYAGDEATLNFYIQKSWVFTVMKIDTMQMKKNKEGTYSSDVTPTRFQFSAEKPIYPLKITQLSVKDKTEALFYVQAPFKVDLPGEFTYQYQWVGLLDGARGCTTGSLPGKGDDWLKAIQDQKPGLLKQAEELGFPFLAGQRPKANQQGRTATSLDWAKKLSLEDLAVLQGQLPFSDTVPDPDSGFTAKDLQNAQRAKLVRQAIQQRLELLQKQRPKGYLVREAPAEEVRNLRLLLGHLQSGLFMTKFRKTFARGEMNEDLLLVPARLGGAEDRSEYEESMPVSPP